MMEDKINNSYQNTKPTKTHQNLFSLVELLLGHCEKYNILIWPEFGTLIGFKRHKGIIPWDYDGDFGILVDDKDRFIKTFYQEFNNVNQEFNNINQEFIGVNAEHNIIPKPIIDFECYADDGCFIVRYDNNIDDTIDIVLYTIKDFVTIESLMSDSIKKSYPVKNNYVYDFDDIYPFKQEIILGHNVYIPNKWEKILQEEYGDWEEIPEEYMNFIDSKFCESPNSNIITFYDINRCEDLFRLIDKSSEPIIIKHTDLLNIQDNEYSRSLEYETEIFGYVSSTDWNYETYTGKEIWGLYENRRLNINIVDSPVYVSQRNSILPSIWQNRALDLFPDKLHYSLTWVLTNSHKITHFHIDPEYGTGGFMKLLEGQKIWWCVLAKDIEYLLSLNADYTIDTFKKMSFYEIVTFEDYYLWGRIRVGCIKSGDILWFPKGCLHKVITLKDSFGFGGYI